MTKFNFLELALTQGNKRGQLSLISMPRLKVSLSELGMEVVNLEAVRIDYALKGMPQKQYQDMMLPVLQLTIHTELPLPCQRCFESISTSHDLQFLYVLCEHPPEVLNDDDAVDWLDSTQSLGVEELVEDELLMALPIAVMHDHQCVDMQQTAGEAIHPFAALQKLKKNP